MRNKISRKQLREFGFVLGFGIPIFIGWLVPMISGHEFRFWTIWIGSISFILGFIFPQSLKIPFKIWMAVGHILGLINSHLILGIIFFIMLQPISIIMKFFGYDPLRKRKNNEVSYKEYRTNPKIDLTKIF